jgi:DNA-binding NarL/FixJ family response regulator
MPDIRVVLVDDHPVVRNGIRNLLDSAVGIQVVGDASLGEEALQMVEALKPDVLLLDMELPDISGNEVAQRLADKGAEVKILALSAFDDREYIQDLLTTGASGYLVKDEVPENIVEAVRGVARGEQGWVSRQVAARMTSWMQEENQGHNTLTPREMQVLKGVVDGKTNQEIGVTLSISEKTVEKHLDSVYTKLKVASRVEAAVMAVREGWI